MQCTLRTVTGLLTGTWLYTDFKLNGHNVLKKSDQNLFLWYTAHGPAWYIADSYVPDGGSWVGLQWYARIADSNGSPCGDIFIPIQSQNKANWVLTAAAVFVPKMAHSLVQKFEILKNYLQQVEKKYEAVKEENEQLKLQLQQYELEYGQVGGIVQKKNI